MEAETETSEDAVLGGKLLIRQPRRGHRVGHDAILLAAATGACPGERAVEFGAGVGAAGLALAARIPRLKVTLIEIDPDLCALAADNARLNGLGDRVAVLRGDVEDINSLSAAGLVPGSVDRILMNPPFHDARRENVSPDPRRRLAHVAPPGLLRRWVAAAAQLLKPDGVLTLIWRADGSDDVLDALRAAFGRVAVLPVQPRTDTGPIRVLVKAIKGGRVDRTTLTPFVLNDQQGRPTAAAEAVLRAGKTLIIAET